MVIIMAEVNLLLFPKCMACGYSFPVPQLIKYKGNKICKYCADGINAKL